MAREEKPLYDLGQSLRAAVETNVSEGRSWKDEIDIQARDEGGLALAGPVEEGGKIAGAVLTETMPGAAPASVRWMPALLGLIVPLVVMALLLPLLRNRPLMALTVAAVLVLFGVLFVGSQTLASLTELRTETENAIAGRLTEARDAAVAAFGVARLESTPRLDPAAWDVDEFRQPLAVVTADGAIESELAASLERERESWWKLTAPFGVLSLILLAWVGLGGAAKTAATLSRHRRAYYYVLPAIGAMVLLVFFPFSYGIGLSFTNSNIYNTGEPITDIWIGVKNFLDILTDFEVLKTTEEGRVFNYQNFYWTMGFTIIWTVTNVALGVSVGLFLALLLNRKGLALRPIYRVLLILPWAVPNYITALIWKGMFHSQFGVINQVVQMFGGDPLSWFDRPFTSFLTVLATNGWLSFPFMMVISLGALQSIPSDLYEAARVDGASRWQQFKTITLPSIKPALVPAIIISVVWTFNMFNIIYLVSEGEPGGSTEILITEAYKIAFEQYRYGYAAAYSVVIFLILLVYGTWQSRVTKATEGI
ncbi:MAG: ABC transporter permease subunit [bacterium]|nr:ABC transporter permease subunit [bacterium]